jgi:hypothetical protein
MQYHKNIPTGVGKKNESANTLANGHTCIGDGRDEGGYAKFHKPERAAMGESGDEYDGGWLLRRQKLLRALEKCRKTATRPVGAGGLKSTTRRIRNEWCSCGRDISDDDILVNEKRKNSLSASS